LFSPSAGGERLTDEFHSEAQIGKGRLGEKVTHPEIRIEYPGWVLRQVDWTRLYPGHRDRMRVALHVARENVERKTGGPFGAAIFEAETGRLVSVGINQVVPLNNSLLHAETFAIAAAEHRLGISHLGGPGQIDLELHTTVEPCPMCVGALLLSGIASVVCGALASDITMAGYELIPNIGATVDELKRLGVHVHCDVLRDEAREVLRLYRAKGGPTS
jgi:tRNA(Arg) A34 adenosine deaminase TadA